jgi:hypothetical protein
MRSAQYDRWKLSYHPSLGPSRHAQSRQILHIVSSGPLFAVGLTIGFGVLELSGGNLVFEKNIDLTECAVLLMSLMAL